MSESIDALRREVAVLRARVEELSRGGRGAELVVDEPVPEGELEVVVCRLGEARVGFLLEHIEEVVMIAATTPVPEAPPWMLGLLDLRGAMVPVIDLAARVERGAAAPAVTDQVLITSGGGRRVGLVVAGVEGVARFAASARGTPADAPWAAYVRAVLIDERGPVLLLGLQRLIASSDVPETPP